MEAAERQLLEFGLGWYDRTGCTYWAETRPVAPSSPSCHFTRSEVAVADGTVHQVRCFRGAPPQGESVVRPGGGSEEMLGPDEVGPPLVLLHGFGAGAPIYYAALPALRAQWPGAVYALDWFGCSLSTRPPWTLGYGHAADTEAIERFFTEPLEQWRQASGIGQFVLVGHSIGGYLSSCYALAHPDLVVKLLLVSPAGVTGLSPATVLEKFIWRSHGFNPLMAVWRLSQLIGRKPLQGFFGKFRGASWLDCAGLVEYHYQSTLNGEVSGGHCLTGLIAADGTARNPLGRRLHELGRPIGFLYGTDDGYEGTGAPGRIELAQRLGAEPEVLRVAGAGHDVEVCNPVGFAEAVLAFLSEDSAAQPGRIYGEAAIEAEFGTGGTSRQVDEATAPLGEEE